MNVGLILVLIAGIYLLRIRPIPTDQDDQVPVANPARRCSGTRQQEPIVS